MTSKGVEFKVGKESLRGTMFVPSGKPPFPGVVFFHRSGSSRARYLPAAQSLGGRGVLTLAFDFRGCGKSDGVYKEQFHQNAIEDARAGLNFLFTQKVDKKRIGMCGGSFGGYLASYILPEYPQVKSLVLRCPAAFSDKFLKTHIDRGDEGNEFEFFKNRKNWESSPTFENVSKFKGPVLIIKAGKDEIIPGEVVDSYYNSAKASLERKLKVIKGADHRLSGNWLDEFTKLTKNWFLETL